MGPACYWSCQFCRKLPLDLSLRAVDSNNHVAYNIWVVALDDVQRVGYHPPRPLSVGVVRCDLGGAVPDFLGRCGGRKPGRRTPPGMGDVAPRRGL